MIKPFVLRKPLLWAAFALSLASTSTSWAQNPAYSINVESWPKDVVQNMLKEAPELASKQLNQEQINLILKKLDQKFKFNGLRVVKTEGSNELILSGEISPQIEAIEFQGLEDLSESDALATMNLSTLTALDEDYVKAAADRLTQYYQEQGYRFATTQYEFKTVSTFKKSVLIKVSAKKQTVLSDVQLTNLDTDTTEIFLKKLNAQFKGRVLNQDNLNKLGAKLRQLLSQNGYYLTPVPSPQLLFSADESKAKVQFKLEKRNRYGVEILNAKEFPRLHLEEDILKLDTYFATDTNFGSELIEKLQTFYKAEGYPHIDIPYYERKEADRQILTFNLEEGPFTRLKTISFIGQYSRDAKFYEKLFLSLGSEKLKSRTYVKEDIDIAAKSLLVSLQNEGFVNARLGRVQIYTDRENPEQGAVTIQLYEGEQVSINSVQFVGNTRFSADQLKAVVGLQPGQKLNLKNLELAVNKLKVHYTTLGYIEFNLLNESTDLITYSEKNSTADIKFNMYEGPLVEVQSILIEGNTRTKDQVILSEIEFKPGDILTPAKLEESIARLQRTGFFGSIDILTLEAGTNIPQRTVIIKVTERDPGVRTIGTGITNENQATLHGFLGIAYRNLGGWGRGVSLRGEGNYNLTDVKYLEKKITFGYVEPYLFDTRARFRLNITRSDLISDYDLRKVTELNSTTYSLEQDFTSHFTAIWDVLNIATYVDRGITREDEIANKYTRDDLVIASTGPTFDLDYRNNLFNPTDGSFSRLSLEYAAENLGSFKVDDFLRITGQTTFYIPVNNSAFVIAQSFRGGYIRDVRSTGYGIPFDKKGFILGGRTTVRGYESSEFFPSNNADTTKYPDSLGVNYKLQTYAAYQLIKSELRFPLVAKWDLMGAIFYDGGQVIVDGFTFEDRWRDAIGIGIRYNTPIGALNLEYAKKLDRKPYESDGAFHLSVGVF
ncbi:MAG: BamA/TamA family outer membrane protein [Bdellovibrio sp.]|nr:BamA/TamA family outer membrane protein [Bdellovibrio sp.]